MRENPQAGQNNKHRTIASKTSRPEDYTRYSNTRRASKVMIKQKMNLYASKLKEPLRENPKRFWTYVKTTAKPNRYPNFLRDGQHIVSDTKQMADMFNIHFQSVFNTNELVDNAIPGVFPSCTNAEDQLSNIQLTPPGVENALNTIDPKNPHAGPDKIPCRLLKELAPQIACLLCRLFNLSLSLGVFPDRWKLADLTPIFKKDDFTLIIDLSRCYASSQKF